jgi:protein-tyrosine phosphatase
VIDLHNHLVPGVDDGAATPDEARAALQAMRAQGVHTLVATPHLNGSATAAPAALEEWFRRVDPAFATLRELAAQAGVRVEPGAEVMLDTPAPDLSDPRLRLAGTDYVLVEFPFMTIPPNAPQVLFDLQMRGWKPVLAHPERYHNLDPELDGPREWRRVGAVLQVNAGSVLGRYGAEARDAAWRMLREGLADLLCSDYHARGEPRLQAAGAALQNAGGAEQAELLMEANPGRVIAGQPLLPVPPLTESAGFWGRLFGRRR